MGNNVVPLTHGTGNWQEPEELSDPVLNSRATCYIKFFLCPYESVLFRQYLMLARIQEPLMMVFLMVWEPPFTLATFVLTREEMKEIDSREK